MTGMPSGPQREEIASVVAGLAARVPEPALLRASAELSLAYRAAVDRVDDGARAGALRVAVGSDLAALAYLVTRFPATFAACGRVFSLVSESLGDWRPRDVVDVGAGPGTAALAAVSAWPSLEAVQLLEPGGQMRQLGEELCGRLGMSGPGWRWSSSEPAGIGAAGGVDLVTMAYVLGEVGEGSDDLVARWWERCSGLLVVVEPGTPAGFGRVRRIRSLLVSLGGTVVAPCPHDAPCPMGEGDWCHFGVRLARSSLHRRMKEGELGWEDEKFSFAAVARPPVLGRSGSARILRRPVRQRRRVDLSLCTGDGLRSATIGRSASSYRRAVKSAWGDSWPAA